MRILIENSGYEMRNFGDIAMLQVAIFRLKEEFPDAELHVFTTQPGRLKMFCPDVIPVPSAITINGRALWCEAWNIFGGLHRFIPAQFHTDLRLLEQFLRNKYSRLMSAWIHKRFAKRHISTDDMDRFLSLIASSDIVVATGGGYLTDTFGGHATFVLSLLALAQAQNIPTYMFGQGLGPIKSAWLQGLSKQTLPHLSFLGLREGRSNLPFLSKLGINNNNRKISVTGDDAIELAHKNKPENLGNGIGINIRVASYSEVGEQLLGEVRKVLHRTCEKYSAAMIPIPISRHEGDSDIATMAKIADAFDDKYLDALDTPQKIIENAGECRIVVTGSYHAGVFALSQGVSVIGLAKSEYYQTKFNGLADQFKLGVYVVDMTKEDFPQELNRCMEEAWVAAPKNRIPLLKQSQRQIDLSKKAYRELRDWNKKK